MSDDTYANAEPAVPGEEPEPVDPEREATEFAALDDIPEPLRTHMQRRPWGVLSSSDSIPTTRRRP